MLHHCDDQRPQFRLKEILFRQVAQLQTQRRDGEVRRLLQGGVFGNVEGLALFEILGGELGLLVDPVLLAQKTLLL
jgi:hypothetical protein